MEKGPNGLDGTSANVVCYYRDVEYGRDASGPESGLVLYILGLDGALLDQLPHVIIGLIQVNP